ncbi:7688_t:CDS:2 [Dentiscutata erythropus]|uniref:7688_t:CDS:1 n=1 Tax=Dentiscutata erythropus TaxID=1348616 RepID=A0A9N9ED42_9GLOM|nr:7688_t:CDS:2 [Dentiscutata erythropus]
MPPNNSDGEKQSVSSNKSASNVATLFLQKLYTNNKSALSEIILFGFDLECLKERQINDSQVQIQKNKPFHQLKSESQKKSRLQTLAYDIHSRIESTLDLHNFHNTKLDHVELNIDESPIKFQNLAAVMPEIEQEYKVEKHRQEITETVNDMISVYPVQINFLAPNGAYHSLKDILNVLISKLAYGNSSVLKIGDVVYIKLSRNGRQMGKHHNHVMFTACILNQHKAVLSPPSQHCIFLYTGIEQYESLQQAFNFLIKELLTLNMEGIIDLKNNHWPIEFWFGTD